MTVDFLIGLSRRRKTSLVMFIDYLMLLFSFWISLSLRSNEIYLPTTSGYYLIFFAPIISIPILYSFGLYQSLIRYSNYRSVLAVIFAITVYTLLWFALVLGIGIVEKPYDFLFINWLVSIFFIGAPRYYARYYLLQKAYKNKRVLIYGAGSAGTQIYSALNYDSSVNVVGFIDDEKELQNKYIENIRIFNPNDIEALIKKKKVDELYIAIPSASKTQIASIIENFKDFPIKIRKLPAIGDLASGKIDISDLKKINIQDLLKREQRNPIEELMKRDIFNKNVIVTGAGGSIGSELAKQILNHNPKTLLLLDISEFSLYKIEQEIDKIKDSVNVVAIIADVTNQNRLEKIMSDHNIQTVYHAAAYKHVPMVERNPLAAINCNIFGTLSCIRASMKQQVESFVFISTDKAVRPTNIMGATKRFAEQILQSVSNSFNQSDMHTTRISIVRFGNVLGSSGSVVPLFKRQIQEGGPLTVTDPNIIRYFMTIQEASQLVIQAGAIGHDGDIFLLDMGEPVKVLDLAKDMIRLSGKSIKDDSNPDGEIEIKFTGLRPGEKLFEELLIDSESEPTVHEKILVAKDKHLRWDEIEILIQNLEEASKDEDYEKIKEIFLKSVAGYKPDTQTIRA